jgi:glyoxylase-like metal-dependent hydrolase (beta-lactamase superfamily II)
LQRYKAIITFETVKSIVKTKLKEMEPKIHTYTSKEPMLRVNAYIIETDEKLVIVDTTLTMSDSNALKIKAQELEKPIAGIILTHGHPDHVAGAINIATKEVPIYALASVKKLMEDTEQIKHQQWSALFGNEWIPKWRYPTNIVSDGQVINIAGHNFKVLDIGSGGDCDANSIWLLEGENPVAFLGDFTYNNNHTYMADGSILRWLANLESYSDLLKSYNTYYVGHGEPCNFTALEKQKEYFLFYCAELLKATKGSAFFTDETRKQFEGVVLAKFPSYGCQFMVGLAADKVASELRSLSHQ